jgi:hypothetical protein
MHVWLITDMLCGCMLDVNSIYTVTEFFINVGELLILNTFLYFNYSINQSEADFIFQGKDYRPLNLWQTSIWCLWSLQCVRLYAGDVWYEVYEFNKNIAVNFNLNVFLTFIDTMLIHSDTFGICRYFHSWDDIGELLLSKILRSTKSSVHCSPIWNGCWHRHQGN